MIIKRQRVEMLMRVLRQYIRIFLSAVIALVLLSIFVLGYSYAGIHLINKTGSTDYKWRQNELKTTMSEGFAWLRMDENGFSNESIPDIIDSLIIGSSHMEAVQMKHEENVSGRLYELLPMNTYNIGMSGHTIYRCVDNYKSALKEYKPSKYSIIETSTIHLSVPEMQAVIDSKANRISSYDSGLIYYLQLIPAFRPVYNQLENWVKLQNPVGGGTTQIAKLPEGYTDTLHSFLSIVPNTATENNITPIIFYHPSEKLNSDGTVTYNTEQIYLDCFASTCEDLGIVFIDMTDSFKTLYANEHQLAHGFINTGAASGHLNKYGHRVIAEKLAEVIQGLEAE